MPVSVVQLTLMEIRLFRRPTHTKPIWAVYDLIGGTFVTGLEAEPERTAVQLDGDRIQPIHKVVDAAKALDKVSAAHDRAKSDEARQQHRNRLTKLGVPDLHTVTTGASTPFLYPIRVALTRQRTTERLIVVDSVRSRVDADLSVALSKNIAWVRDSLGLS